MPTVHVALTGTTHVDWECRIDQAHELERRAATVIVGLAYLADTGAWYACLGAICEVSDATYSHLWPDTPTPCPDSKGSMQVHSEPHVCPFPKHVVSLDPHTSDWRACKVIEEAAVFVAVRQTKASSVRNPGRTAAMFVSNARTPPVVLFIYSEPIVL